MGCYYLTLQRDGLKGEGKAFCSEDEGFHGLIRPGSSPCSPKIKVRIERSGRAKPTAGSSIPAWAA